MYAKMQGKSIKTLEYIGCEYGPYNLRGLANKVDCFSDKQ